MTRRLALALCCAILAGSAAVGGYVLNGPKWGVQQIPYYVNPANSDMPEDSALAAIQAGAMDWTAQSNANIMWYYMGRTSGSSLTQNSRNEMFFRNTSAGSMAAETYWWYDGSYRLIEADIVFYDGGFTFVGSGSGCAGGVYLEDIAIHEFGHALGLGHSAVSTATMYPAMGWCSTELRTLDADDLAGIEKLYPATTGNTSPSVTISAPASASAFASNTSIGFSGSASDREDGSLSATIAWTSSIDGPIGTGSSFQRVLSAGSHTITARVTDSRGSSADTQVLVTIGGAFTLSARGYKVKGTRKVDLTWSGASSGSIDVYRNGARVATTSNTGRYTDSPNRKGGGAYTYTTCEAGTSICSNQVSITF
jgi:hypothetical protein